MYLDFQIPFNVAQLNGQMDALEAAGCQVGALHKDSETGELYANVLVPADENGPMVDVDAVLAKTPVAFGNVYRTHTGIRAGHLLQITAVIDGKLITGTVTDTGEGFLSTVEHAEGLVSSGLWTYHGHIEVVSNY